MLDFEFTAVEQEQGVVDSNDSLVLYVDNRVPTVEVAVLDTDYDGIYDQVLFVPEEDSDTVYYSLNFKNGPFTSWVVADGPISISKHDIFVYYYATTSAGKSNDLGNHILNVIKSKSKGNRFTEDMVLRVFKYDFTSKSTTTFYEYPVSDIQSLTMAVFEIKQAIPPEDRYFIEVENSYGKSVAQEFTVSFDPTVSFEFE